MSSLHVVSLYDAYGDGLRPWADAGFSCFAYSPKKILKQANGDITFIKADLNSDTLNDIVSEHRDQTAFFMAYPPCEALSGGGARWWREKFLEDPDYQNKAVHVVKDSWKLAVALGNVPFYVENPPGVLGRLWREPDYRFEPYEYGGYLSKRDLHPRWPDHIPAQDAYRRRICLWTGHGFEMPAVKLVSPQRKAYGKTAPRVSRRVIPRAFSQAVFLANH